MRVAVAVACLMSLACAKADDAPRQPVEVEIVGHDYAFQMPQRLAAGSTIFRFINRGKVEHELNVSLLKEGVSMEQFLNARKNGVPTLDMVEASVGVLFAKAGTTSSSGLATELKPGRQYAVICIFRDSPDAKRHLEMGMYSVITVADSAPPRNATLTPADTIVGSDYSFRYPSTLAPGPHRFVFRNEGKVRHQVSFALLKKGATLQQALAAESAGQDIEQFLEPESFGLLLARGGSLPAGELTIDMLPEREYAIVCFAQDDEKSPPHVALGMVGSITTTAAGSNSSKGAD